MKNRLKNLGNISVLESDNENQVNQKQVIEELQKKTYDLGERVKELNCLYTISHLIEKPDVTLDEILQGTVNIIPPSWQYPEITCAKITFKNNVYTTDNFLETEWLQQCHINNHRQIVGSIEIYYFKKMPDFDEGPFLKEERSLITAISERLGKEFERIEAEKELRKTNAELEQRVAERTSELAQANMLLEIDISKRIQCEEALRESEEKFRVLVETTTDLVWEINSKAIFTYVSPQIENILGYKPEEIIGESGFLLMLPEEQEKFGEIFDKLRIKGDPILSEATLNSHKDGSLVILESNGTAVYDDNGNVIGYRGVARDITKHKQAEDALRESEKKFRTLVENSSDWIWEVNSDCVYTYVSPQIETILGYTPKEVLGKSPFEFMSLAEKEKVGKIFNNLSEKGEPIISIENINTHKDGSQVILETSGVAVLDEEGNITGYRGIDRDITIRKQFENKLNEERKRAQTYLDIANVLFVALDDSGIVTLVNQKTCEIFGYTEEEMVGKNWFDNFIPEHLRAMVKDVAKQLMQGIIKTVEYFENPVLTKSGDERIIAWYNTIVRDSNGIIIGNISSGEDITERVQAEEALKESEEKFSKIFMTSPNPITITSLERGEIVDVNQSCEEAFGYSKEEVTGRTTLDLDLWCSSNERNKFKDALKENESLKDFELKIKRKDGKIRTCLVAFSKIQLNSKSYIVSVALDVTERKLQKIALVEANKLLANEKVLLSNKNIALQEVLGRIADQKEEIKLQLHKNISNVILPMIEPLKKAAEPSFINMLNLLESSLTEITSPLVDRLENLYAKLTPRETEICNLIKAGFDSKEIADNLHLSVNTIHTQRRRIRKKLGINDNKTNLTNYLKSI